MHTDDHGRPEPGGASRRAAQGFRPEIQALRAIAVVSVVLYHLWPQWFPGGFIGVDVFFVVSGFLITGNLVREAEASGRVSLAGFWANRVRRIMPAGLLAIVVTTVASIWLLPPTRLVSLTTHALASVFYGENWLLAQESVDYLAQTNASSPFQHFWSLGVEEQFYLVWPLVVAIVAMSVARPHARRAFAYVFGAVVMVSFIWSWVMVSRGDPTAYFATQARLWQLGAGALLALLPSSWKLPSRSRFALSVGSVVLVGAAVVWIQPSMPFPGPLALVPVLAAVMMIAASANGGEASMTSVGVLGWRPVQWLGDISYSLYLWHFPPVVIFAAVAGSGPGLASGVGLAAISVLLAAASFYFVEQPARRSLWLKASSRRTLGAGAVAMGLAALLACTPLIPIAIHQREVAASNQPPGDSSRRGAMAFDLTKLPSTADPSSVSPGQPIQPDPLGELALPTMPGKSYSACQANGDEVSPTCSWGPTDARVTIAVVGDSNAAQYLPALLDLADQRNWRIELYTRSECPFNPDMVPTNANNSACPGANAETMRKLVNEVRPDVVFTAASSSYRFRPGPDGDSEPPGATGFARYWGELENAGIRVVAVRPIPRPRRDPVECVALHLQDPVACAEPRKEDVAPAVEELYRRAAELAPGIRTLDLTDQACSSDRCFAVLGSVLVYRDKAHFSVEFVRTLTETLGHALADVT